MDTANSQFLRSAVDRGLASGEACSATQVLDRLEAKYAALVDAEKMIDEITDDNLHQEVGTGKPVGKEVL